MPLRVEEKEYTKSGSTFMQPTKDEFTNVLVYGTLKKGHHAHHLLDNFKFFSEATLDGYKMIDLGSYPGIIKKQGYSVQVEMYSYNGDDFKRDVGFLDQYEGYDRFDKSRSLYVRELMTIKPNGQPHQTQAYGYEYNVGQHNYQDGRLSSRLQLNFDKMEHIENWNKDHGR